MTTTTARLLSVTVLGAVLTGCATVPGDPYYEPQYQVHQQPGYIYTQPAPVYGAPAVVYRPAPTPIYYGARDNRDPRWDNNRRDRERLERERQREERERADRERQRREQQARDNSRRDRDREQARRAQAERERRAHEDRREREARPGRQPQDIRAPHPHDWRSRQFSNNPEQP
jgi:hypothetical protein